MSTGHQNTTYITMRVAVRRTGLSVRQVQKCIELGFIVDPISADDLRELRRIRRLQERGVYTPPAKGRGRDDLGVDVPGGAQLPPMSEKDRER